MLSKPLQLLYLEWLDAGTITNGEWITKDELLKDACPESFLNQTVGFLLKEDEVALIVAAQIATDKEEPRYDLVMFIPKVLVRKRKVIKV